MKQAKDLTREETIKALRVCSTEGGICNGCPLHAEHAEDSFGDCSPGDLLIHAADILETALSVQYERGDFVIEPIPCPFCGELLEYHEYDVPYLYGHLTMKVYQHPRSLCFASMMEVALDDIPAWNRRVKP